MKTAQRAAQQSRKAAKAAAKTAKAAVKTVVQIIKAGVTAVKAGAASIASGGWVVLAVIAVVILIVFGLCAAFSLNNAGQGDISGGTESLSKEVLEYTPLIQQYAQKHGIPQFVSILQAVMMQESGGKGSDPMQASECPFNTKYLPRKPNSITDPEYSVDVGVQNFAQTLSKAGCSDPYDTNTLYLALQSYNSVKRS